MNGKEISFNVNLAFDPTRPNWSERVDAPPPFRSRTADQVQQVVVSEQIQSGMQGEEPWRVHFVDLTTHGTADNRPPDPAMASASVRVIPADTVVGAPAPDSALLQVASLHVTDHFMEGRTLVLQVADNMRNQKQTLCESEAVWRASGVQQVAYIDSKWRSVAICDKAPVETDAVMPVAAQLDRFAAAQESGADTAPAEAAPTTIAPITPEPFAAPPAGGSDSLSTMRAAVENQKITVEGIAIVRNTVRIEMLQLSLLSRRGGYRARGPRAFRQRAS